MLVSELDLEVQNGLTVALEAKVARLDDSGVHGAHGDLVDSRPFDPKEGVRASARLVLSGARLQIEMPPQRFEPRVSLRADAVLFVELALECLGLRKLRRERRVAVLKEASPQQAQTSP